jgi:hypothetical protein
VSFEVALLCMSIARNGCRFCVMMPVFIRAPALPSVLRFPSLKSTDGKAWARMKAETRGVPRSLRLDRKNIAPLNITTKKSLSDGEVNQRHLPFGCKTKRLGRGRPS